MTNFLAQGGVFMYIIALMSVVALALIIEKFYRLKVKFKLDTAFFREVADSVKIGNYRKAENLCQRTAHPLAGILSGIFENRKNGKEAIFSSVQRGVKNLFPEVQKRTDYIQMIGNVATLVGLLGTIQGLILSFSSLNGASAGEKAKLLAEGISTAMYTTAFGLCVAVPCVILYTIIAAREEQVLQSYDDVISEVVHAVLHETVGEETPEESDEELLELARKAAARRPRSQPSAGGAV